MKTFSVRMVDLDQDYDAIAPWWPAHGWEAVPRNILPKCGVVALIDGELAAATWLYMDNSTGVAMMEWTVGNPANAPRDSLRSLKLLLGAVREVAAQNDYGVVLTSTKQESLLRVYERGGFRRTDSGMTHLLLLTKL